MTVHVGAGGGGGGVEFWGFRVYLGLRVFSGFPAVEKGLWSLGGLRTVHPVCGNLI